MYGRDLDVFCTQQRSARAIWLGIVLCAATTAICADVTSLPEDLQALVKRCQRNQVQDPRAGIVDCQQAYQALSSYSQPLLRMEMILRQSDSELSIGHLDKAAKSLELASQVSLTTEQWQYRYRMLRRRGYLALQTNQLTQAKLHYQAALAIAEQHRDQKFLAFSHNDLGLTARRQGDLRGAIAGYTAALHYHRLIKSPDLAPTLSNLGDLYTDTQQYADAENRYQEAFELFKAQRQPLEVAHSYERFALLAQWQGQDQRADAQLALAYQQFVDAGSDASALRIRGDQLRLALDRNDLSTASALVQSTVLKPSVQTPLRLVLQLARLSRLQGQAATSLDSLLTTISKLDAEDRNRASFEQEIAEHFAAMNRNAEALVYWRRALVTDREQSLRSFNQDASALRVALEVEENQRVTAEARLRSTLAANKLRQASLQLRWLIASALGAIVLMLLWLRMQKQRRLRLTAEADRTIAQAQLRYQRAEHELQAQSNRYASILQHISTPLAVLDANLELQACTPSFASALGLHMQTLVGRTLDQLVDSTGFAQLQRHIAAIEDADQGDVEIPKHHRMQLRHSSIDMDLAMQALGGQSGFVLSIVTSASVASELNAEVPKSPSSAPTDPELVAATQDSKEANDFWLLTHRRESLVEIMLLALAAFERATGKTRIELAARSKLWSVTNDDGRLRVRAMDRYFSIQRMPRQPRWREVLRTGYYVLSNCQMEDRTRNALERHIEALREQLHDAALLGEGLSD